MDPLAARRSHHVQQQALEIGPFRERRKHRVVRCRSPDLQHLDGTSGLMRSGTDQTPEVLQGHCPGAGAREHDGAGSAGLQRQPVHVSIPVSRLLQVASALGQLRRVQDDHVPSITRINVVSQPREQIRVLEADMENFGNDFLNIVKRHFF